MKPNNISALPFSKSLRVYYSSINTAKRSKDIWSSQTANQTQYVNGIKSIEWTAGEKSWVKGQIHNNINISNQSSYNSSQQILLWDNVSSSLGSVDFYGLLLLQFLTNFQPINAMLCGLAVICNLLNFGYRKA